MSNPRGELLSLRTHLIRLPLIALMSRGPRGSNLAWCTRGARRAGKAAWPDISRRSLSSVCSCNALAAGLANPSPLPLGPCRTLEARFTNTTRSTRSAWSAILTRKAIPAVQSRQTLGPHKSVDTRRSHLSRAAHHLGTNTIQSRQPISARRPWVSRWSWGTWRTVLADGTSHTRKPSLSGRPFNSGGSCDSLARQACRPRGSWKTPRTRCPREPRAVRFLGDLTQGLFQHAVRLTDLINFVLQFLLDAIRVIESKINLAQINGHN